MGRTRQRLVCLLSDWNKPTRKVCPGYVGCFSVTGEQLGQTLKSLPVAGRGQQTEIGIRSLKFFAIAVTWSLDGVVQAVRERILV